MKFTKYKLDETDSIMKYRIEPVAENEAELKGLKLLLNDLDIAGDVRLYELVDKETVVIRNELKPNWDYEIERIENSLIYISKFIKKGTI